MKIAIKTTAYMPEIPSEIEIESGTLYYLLLKIFSNLNFAVDVADLRSGEFKFDDMFQLLLNNVSYHSLPRGLNTELHDEDIVTLSLILLGGG